MNRFLLTIFLLLSTACMLFAQQNKKMLKPKVMVVPEEAFCINSGMFKYVWGVERSGFSMVRAQTAEVLCL